MSIRSFATAPPVSCNSHFVVGEPMGAEAWFPSNNHPADKAAYVTSITVPAARWLCPFNQVRSKSASSGRWIG